MYSKKTTILNKTGIHARPATVFVNAAAKFKSQITIKKAASGREANAKSIVIVLTLALSQGSEVELKAEGVDEVEAVDTLVSLIESGFGEL